MINVTKCPVKAKRRLSFHPTLVCIFDSFRSRVNSTLYTLYYSLFLSVMDLFSLFFSYFTLRDATIGNSHMHVQMYLKLMKRKKENSHENNTWSEI